MSEKQPITDWLGLGISNSELRMLEVIERGIPISIVNRLRRLGLSQSEIDSLVISRRALQRHCSRREKLSSDESDRLVRVMRLLSHAEDVFGSRERALAWLRRPRKRLRNMAPLQLLRTDAGGRAVEEVLFQIEHGMFV
jgi:putative toxin-antitoxin system antitoxin component (TIGR02293 family)